MTATRTVGSELQLAHPDSYALNAAMSQTFAVAGGNRDRADRVRALERRRDGLLRLDGVAAGATVSLITYEKRIAAATLTALPNVGSPRISFTYTVWA
ncbi:MAG: hypothetical protein ACLGIF_04385 [Actinomycetes bacterium]